MRFYLSEGRDYVDRVDDRIAPQVQLRTNDFQIKNSAKIQKYKWVKRKDRQLTHERRKRP